MFIFVCFVCISLSLLFFISSYSLPLFLPSIHSPTHSFIHSFIHSFPHPLIHPITHSLVVLLGIVSQCCSDNCSTRTCIDTDIADEYTRATKLYISTQGLLTQPCLFGPMCHWILAIEPRGCLFYLKARRDPWLNLYSSLYVLLHVVS